MAYDELLAQRVRAVQDGADVVEKPMFGGLAFLVAGHLAVAVGDGELMVRVGAEDAEGLLGEPGTEAVVMGTRRMRGWLVVRGAALTDVATLQSWVGRGVAYAGSLPPKG